MFWFSYLKFYICSSMHCNSWLKKSNKMQLYADIYLMLNYSTCFGRPPHPSSGVHKTVVAASGTDATTWEASFFKCDQIRTGLGHCPKPVLIWSCLKKPSQTSPYLVMFEESCFPDSMICTRGCNYSFYVFLMMGEVDAQNM